MILSAPESFGLGTGLIKLNPLRKSLILTTGDLVSRETQPVQNQVWQPPLVITATQPPTPITSEILLSSFFRIDVSTAWVIGAGGRGVLFEFHSYVHEPHWSLGPGAPRLYFQIPTNMDYP